MPRGGNGEVGWTQNDHKVHSSPRRRASASRVTQRQAPSVNGTAPLRAETSAELALTLPHPPAPRWRQASSTLRRDRPKGVPGSPPDAGAGAVLARRPLRPPSTSRPGKNPSRGSLVRPTAGAAGEPGLRPEPGVQGSPPARLPVPAVPEASGCLRCQPGRRRTGPHVRGSHWPGEVLQDLFFDEPSHGAGAGGAALSLGSSLPPLFEAVSSLSGLTRPKERRLSAHARERPEAPAEATAAASVAGDREHLPYAAAAAADAILAAASPKRPGGGRGRDRRGAGRARGGAGQRTFQAGAKSVRLCHAGAGLGWCPQLPWGFRMLWLAIPKPSWALIQSLHLCSFCRHHWVSCHILLLCFHLLHKLFCLLCSVFLLSCLHILASFSCPLLRYPAFLAKSCNISSGDSNLKGSKSWQRDLIEPRTCELKGLTKSWL